MSPCFYFYCHLKSDLYYVRSLSLLSRNFVTFFSDSRGSDMNYFYIKFLFFFIFEKVRMFSIFSSNSRMDVMFFFFTISFIKSVIFLLWSTFVPRYVLLRLVIFCGIGDVRILPWRKLQLAWGRIHSRVHVLFFSPGRDCTVLNSGRTLSCYTSCSQLLLFTITIVSV